MGASAQTNRVAEARLKEKNIVLPAETASLGNYVNAVQTGNLLYVSGTIAGVEPGSFEREVGEGSHARARVSGGTPSSAQNSLARVRGAIGSLDRVKRVVKVVGMVNSAEDFSDQPKVVNGVSDLLVEVFGELCRPTCALSRRYGWPARELASRSRAYLGSGLALISVSATPACETDSSLWGFAHSSLQAERACRGARR